MFKTFNGPVLKAFAALEPAGRADLERDIVSLIGQFNRSGDGTMVVPSDYLEIVVTRNLGFTSPKGQRRAKRKLQASRGDLGVRQESNATSRCPPVLRCFNSSDPWRLRATALKAGDFHLPLSAALHGCFGRRPQ